MKRFVKYDIYSPVENDILEKDFADAQKIERYRIGRKAFYEPAFPAWRYFPLKDFSDVSAGTKLMRTKSCGSGGGIDIPALIAEKEGYKQIFQFDKAVNAQKAEALIKERT